MLDAQFEKAKICARIGDKVEAYAAYDAIAEKAKISTGKKIDAVMAKTRVALFHLDTLQASKLPFDCCRGYVVCIMAEDMPDAPRSWSCAIRCRSDALVVSLVVASLFILCTK